MLRLAFACSLLALTAAAPPKPDWTRTVATTATGWQIGNPKAPRRLVEYLSLNCPHCAEVSKELGPELRAAVLSGRMSWEIRPMGLFPHDAPAVFLARCVQPGRRLEFIEAYFGESASFTGRLQAAQATAAGVGKLREAAERDTGSLAVAVADLAGMKPLAARFGLTGAGYDRCLRDPAASAWFGETHRRAGQSGVSGTPTFFVDGRRLSFRSMDELRSAIFAARP